MTKLIASHTSWGVKVEISSCGIGVMPGCPALEYEQDQESDGEAEQAGRFGQGKAEKGEGLHLRLCRRVAGDGADQGREHIADADAGADERDAGEARADHFRGSEVHVRFPLCAGMRWWRVRRRGLVQMEGVAQVETRE